MPPSCGLLGTLFVGAVACAIAGNALGILAWRGRRPERPARAWLHDPLYLFRSSDFQQPRAPSRLAAIVLLGAGAVCLAVLAVLVMVVQNSGADSVCGFSF